MRLPAIDPEARKVLQSMAAAERIDVIADLGELEIAGADPMFVATELGVAVGATDEEIFVTRVGRRGRWWVYWRLLPRDPPPLRHVHVLVIEPAPSLPIL